MRQLITILSFTFALGLLGDFPASTAFAKKKVVVSTFRGPGARAARVGVIRGLKRRARMVSSKRYRRTAGDLGVDIQDATGRSAVAAELKLSAIIEGRVRRVKRRRYTLTITVYDGRSGERLGRRTVRARKKRRLKRAGIKAAKRIAKLLRQAQVGEQAPVAAPPPVDPEPVPMDIDKDDEDDDAEAKADAEAMRKENDEEGLSAEAEGGSRPRGLVQLSAAFGFAKRYYKLDAATAIDREYDGGFYPEVILALETYPLLLTTRGALSGLGLGASFSRHLSISTEQDTTSEAVESSSMELLVDLRYRWLFSSSSAGPVAYGLAGYGMRSFDLADNDTLTTFSYQFINVAVGGRMPLGTELLAFEAEFSLRPILKAGQEAIEAFGERSGGIGFGVRGGLSGRLAMGLYYFATFEYLSFPSEFAGLTSTQRVVELAEPSSGSDTFMRFWTGVGYAL